MGLVAETMIKAGRAILAGTRRRSLAPLLFDVGLFSLACALCAAVAGQLPFRFCFL